MNPNTSILSKLIDEDFDLETKEGSRWGTTDLHSSLVLDKEKGIFFWNSQNVVGDSLVYLTKVRGYSFEKAKEYLKKFKDYSGDFVYSIQSGKEDVVVYPKLVDVFFDMGKEARKYFYNRGLTDHTIDTFRLGFYNGFNTVPIIESASLRNFQLRKDDPKIIRMYYKNLEPLLFNVDILALTKTAYVTEGPVDAMVMVQNGFPAVCSTVAGYFNPTWTGKFVNQKEIFILYDNDSAGRSEAIKVAKVLGEYRCKVYCFQDFEDYGYDPVDFFRDGKSSELIEKNAKYIFEMGEYNKNGRPRKTQ